MDLTGLWHYCVDDDPEFSNPGFDDSSWKTMSIPRNWFLGGLDHHGVVWFRAEFRHRTNADFTSLQFEGVDYFSDVFLNGQFLGRHTGYFEPFSFDVTGMLRAGKNLLAVRVESPYETPGLDGWHLKKRLIKGVLNHHDCRPGGGWDPLGQSYNTGGIWNRVHLERHAVITIDRILLHADMQAHPAILHAQLAITNRGESCKASIELVCEPDNFKGKSQRSLFDVNLPNGGSVHDLDLPVNDIRIWQPWDRGFPSLYSVTTVLAFGKEKVSRSSLFGFRSVRVAEGFTWFVNDEPYFPRGSNYLASQWLAETLFPQAATGADHPFGGGAGSVPVHGKKEGFYTRDVNLARQANLNILRVHGHVLPPEFHEACDRAGVLVWQDFALQWGYSDAPEIQSDAVRQIQAMVTILYNHPSIVAWCCHNESPWDAPWMTGKEGGRYDPSHNRDLDARLESAVRDLDSTRYIHRNSGSGDGHTYAGWYVGHVRDYQDLPATPFVTEYGAQGLPVKQNILRMLPEFGEDAGFAELVRFKSWLETQRKISPVTSNLIRFGTALWNFTERHKWKSVQEWIKGWGMNVERSIYKPIPDLNTTPVDLHHARQVWETWRFHDFQPPETFDNGIQPGGSLDEFIKNSQNYQGKLIQYSTECFRRAGHSKVTGLIHFDLTDPWPSMTWSVLDYWRTPKPSYNVLQRVMQPVLPCFTIPETIEPGKAASLSFCVVNDLMRAFSHATVEWRLEGSFGDIASAAFPVDIPAYGVTPEIKVTLPSLERGGYVLSVALSSGSQELGNNHYDLFLQ